MDIFSVFKSKVEPLISNSEQSSSEKLIELATFFYKIDNRIALAEQKYVDELLEKIEWKSTVSIESFQTSCIGKLNKVLSSSDEEISIYLSDLMKDLSSLGAVDKAITIAQEISDADGEIADDEIRYLDLVKSYK